MSTNSKSLITKLAARLELLADKHAMTVRGISSCKELLAEWGFTHLLTEAIIVKAELLAHNHMKAIYERVDRYNKSS